MAEQTQGTIEIDASPEQIMETIADFATVHGEPERSLRLLAASPAIRTRRRGPRSEA